MSKFIKAFFAIVLIAAAVQTFASKPEADAPAVAGEFTELKTAIESL